MDHSLFYEITSVLLLAGAVAFVMSWLKQPSVISFIVTGLLVGPFGYIRLHDSATLESLGQIGITLLLFMVGLELDVQKLKTFGKVAFLTGIGQIVFTGAVGLGIASLLGYSLVPAVYIATALTFSSTIIVVKLLGEKHDLQTLYGRIVVGFLVVQDFVAMLILLFLGGTNSSGRLATMPLWQNVAIVLVKALVLGLGLYFVSRFILPKVLKNFWSSSELILAFSIAWALGLAAFASLPWVGFSMEAGGFLAGLALANSQMHYEIGAKIKSIRDFFIIIFFIVFGAQLVLGNITSLVWPAIVFSLFVLIGNPLILLFIMGYLGYKPRTSFMASVTVAQVSEFSFILVALGNRLGHLDISVVSLITFVGIITISLSSYMITYSEKLYEIFKKHLQFFDFAKKHISEDSNTTILKNHIILVGARRLGAHIAAALEKQKARLVVVDFDPDITLKLSSEGYNSICGDITDSYIQEQVNLREARVIISTVPDFENNLTLLEAVREAVGTNKKRPKLVFAAQDEHEAKKFYEKEIDYALSPHFVGGQHLASLLSEDLGLKGLKKFKNSHLKFLGK